MNIEGRNKYLRPNEMLAGVSYADIVNATFSHANATGGRFNPPDRGAWYAGFELATAKDEVAWHRRKFLNDGYMNDTFREEYQDFLADFTAEFDTLDSEEDARYLQPEPVPLCYYPSQLFAFELLSQGSNGIVYPSTRRPGGTCIVCFRPALVYNVSPGQRYILETSPTGEVWTVS